ncbi:MAG TPA: hypothetical protein VF217_01525 [Rhodanobacteraceae bacterium]
MSWRDRLQALRNGKGLGDELTKPTKPPFVSFVSDPDGRFPPAARESSAHSLPATAEQRARLRAIADREGIAPDLIDRLPDADLDGLHLWTDDGLATYARMIEADADRARGRVPRDWTQPAYCRRCGPVLLWPGAPSIVLGCPWCLTRRAGVPLPRPSVACATCAHWRPAAGTQAEGIGTCAAGHLGRYPHQRHGCADWKPAALRTAESSEPAP